MWVATGLPQKIGLPRNGGIAAGEIVDLKPVAGN
jgi:hypothetical protein